jgi:hypothetical protein
VSLTRRVALAISSTMLLSAISAAGAHEPSTASASLDHVMFSDAAAVGEVVGPLIREQGWVPGDTAVTAGTGATDPLVPGCLDLTGDDDTCETWTTMVGPMSSVASGHMGPDGGLFYLVGSSTIVALDPRTGQQVWSDRADSGVFYDVLVSADGSRVFGVGWAPSSAGDVLVSAYDARSGQRLWAATYDGPEAKADLPYGADLTPDGTAVVVVGKTAGSGPINQNGIAFAVATASGELLWQQVVDERGPQDIAIDVAAGDDVVYIASYGLNPGATDKQLYDPKMGRHGRHRAPDGRRSAVVEDALRRR